MNTPEFSSATFNMQGAWPARVPEHDWTAREDLAVSTILHSDPTILGMQEAQFGNLHSLKNKIPEGTYHHYLGHNIDYGTFNPIYWKAERFEAEKVGALWLHPDQKENTPADEWGAKDIRTATWSILRDVQSGGTVCVINTHLDHIGERARIEGTRMILRQWVEFGSDIPTIVTGDINCGRYIPPGLEVPINYSDKPLRLFEEAGFVDVYGELVGDGNHSHTFHNFAGENYNPNQSHGLWRPDVILAKDLDLLSCQIITDASPPTYSSDHYMVIAEVKNRIGPTTNEV